MSSAEQQQQRIVTGSGHHDAVWNDDGARRQQPALNRLPSVQLTDDGDTEAASVGLEDSHQRQPPRDASFTTDTLGAYRLLPSYTAFSGHGSSSDVDAGDAATEEAAVGEADLSWDDGGMGDRASEVTACL